MKTCRVCGTELIVGENWTEGRIKNNGYICRKCASKHAKDSYAANAEQYAVKRKACRQRGRAILRRYKHMVGCLICGEHCAACLDFHAPNGHEDGHVGSMIGWLKIKAEVAWCFVLIVIASFTPVY